MNEVQDDLLYTRSHEWVQRLEGSKVRMGITDHAQHELGDVVYVELSEDGKALSRGDEAGALESVKTVEPFYSPVAGKVIRVNDMLESQPELVNRSPYLEGWLLEIEIDSAEELDSLMGAEDYRQLLEEV